MKKSKIPTILGVLVLIIGLAAGIFLVRNTQLLRIGATPETSPKDVRITNVDDSSFTVSWITDKATLGFVRWGEGNQQNTEEEEGINPSFTHAVTIKGLSPQTSYSFKINSAGVDFDNNGIAWQTTTGPELPAPSKNLLISGTILTVSSEPASNILVYVTVGGGSTLSTTTSGSGNWVIRISEARTQDLASRVAVNETKTIIEISANAGPDGVTSAQIYPKGAKPVPPMILGQVHDFRNLAGGSAGGVPEASLSLPEESTPSSGFEVGGTASPSSQTVTLISVEAGEVVSTIKPEFSGEGPAGVTLTITVESTAQTTSIKIPSNGDWKWTPPSGLSAGAHTITISWKDAAGVLRTLKRTFIVQAAEGPAFESTPSATPTKSPSATASSTPKASPTIKASPTATGTATPTNPPVPESGTLTPTFALTIMGIGVILFGFLVWKKSV